MYASNKMGDRVGVVVGNGRLDRYSNMWLRKSEREIKGERERERERDDRIFELRVYDSLPMAFATSIADHCGGGGGEGHYISLARTR